MSAVECQGKRRYDSFALAQRIAHYQHNKTGDLLHAYACPSCRGFHIGTTNVVEQQKRRDRRRRKMAVD